MTQCKTLQRLSGKSALRPARMLNRPLTGSGADFLQPVLVTFDHGFDCHCQVPLNGLFCCVLMSPGSCERIMSIATELINNLSCSSTSIRWVPKAHLEKRPLQVLPYTRAKLPTWLRKVLLNTRLWFKTLTIHTPADPIVRGHPVMCDRA